MDEVESLGHGREDWYVDLDGRKVGGGLGLPGLGLGGLFGLFGLLLGSHGLGHGGRGGLLLGRRGRGGDGVLDGGGRVHLRGSTHVVPPDPEGALHGFVVLSLLTLRQLGIDVLVSVHLVLLAGVPERRRKPVIRAGEAQGLEKRAHGTTLDATNIIIHEKFS